MRNGVSDIKASMPKQVLIFIGDAACERPETPLPEATNVIYTTNEKVYIINTHKLFKMFPFETLNVKSQQCQD